MSNQRVKIKYPAELFINDRSIENKFPEWFSVLGIDRLKRCHDTKPIQKAYSNETVINSSSESDSNDDNDKEAEDEEVFLNKSKQPIVGNAHENVNKATCMTNSTDRIENNETISLPVSETQPSVSKNAPIANKTQIPPKTSERKKAGTSHSVKQLKTTRVKMTQSQTVKKHKQPKISEPAKR
ncbi:hypothetical protein DPMN_164701 [Dreissena polymorpha]|uniref:Uncharacterized protein n=1 Tax=Dreissena polymorpha TaxID=45954 RepID=A0A9D4ETF3_DREPO|nr:hypothetical protein DPMN_164701 [Dreissena polymorpha]